MKLAARKVLSALPVGALLVGFGIVGCTPPAEVKVPPYQPPTSTPSTDLKNVPVGMSGCLAAACHGAPARELLEGKRDKNSWQGSGSCWAAVDPHTAAYSLLTDHPHRPVKVTAKHIMALYAPGTEATDDARCVACHTNPALATPERFNDPHARALRTEGVSCESCHGSAGGWVSEHTSWKGDRKEVCAKFGMVPLYDLGERALACMGCHVGSPADPKRGLPVRDMNHDMIAAGHPRLNFDFAEYTRRLPVHWEEKDRAANRPRALNPAKVWLVGRVAHAEAACRLLADRAERARQGTPRSPWPELAEYNCASCHHDLRPADEDGTHWRRDLAYLDGRPPGQPPWQTIWPMTPAAGIGAPKRNDAPLKSVIVLMEARRWPAPVQVEKVVNPMITKLQAGLRETVGLSDEEAVSRVKIVLPAGAPQVPEWDSAVQLFFATAALERARNPAPSDVPKEFGQILGAFRSENWKEVTENLNAIRVIQKARP
jgi:hypothetical protein